MAPCTDPSSPTPPDLSVLEKKNIYLNQQQQQFLNQSAYNSNFSPFPAFKPIDDEKSSIARGQVYDPINSLINAWPDFSIVSSTSFTAGDSDTVKEMNTNRITENIKKRKGESNASLKAEHNSIIEEGGANKKMKQVTCNDSHERNASTKEGNRKGKNKKEITTEDSKDNTKDSEALAVTAKPDYIHVRAGRGQATDSHSLAERVRRERISERMSYLQELVPGCNKVTGKAGMLDEIINYVQSLQRQIEFLSMKLAAINPMVDFDIDDFINRQMIPSNAGCLPLSNVLHDQLDPSFLQFNPLQRPAVCYGLEMPIDNPNPAFNGSMLEQVSASDTLGDQYLSANYSSSNWDAGSQNLYCLDPQQARTLGFHF